MKKIYTFLAAAAVVASASAANAVPQRHFTGADVAKSISADNELKMRFDMDKFVAPASRTVSTVEGPFPAFGADGLFITSVAGWYSDAYLNYTEGEDKPTGTLDTTGQPAYKTLTDTEITVTGDKAVIDGFIDAGIVLEGTYMPATPEIPANIIVVESGQTSTSTRLGEDVVVFVYNVNTKQIVEDFWLIYDEELHQVWFEAEIPANATSINDYTERLIVANTTDMSAENYTEYMSLLFTESNAINAVMSYDVKLPNATSTQSRSGYVYAQWAVTEDDEDAAATRTTWIDITNLFGSLFTSDNWLTSNYEVNFETQTAYAEDVCVANPNVPASSFYVWNADMDDTVFEFELFNTKTQAGNDITVMFAESLVVSNMTLTPANTCEISNATISLPFALDLDANTGVSNVVANENAPVEYFNLQGVRVANPENGLYIRRQGSEVSKVLVK